MMTFRQLAGLLTVLVACLAVGASDALAIVGGNPAAPGHWPWMAALVDEPDAFNGEMCGATVIGARRLLTAGHCVIGERASGLSVIVGRTRLTGTGGKRVQVSGVSVFSGYQQRSPGLDAAIVTVDEDLGIAPVALADGAQFSSLADGTPAWTVGWGQLTASRHGHSDYWADRLRELGTPLVGDDTCERAYGGGDGYLTYRPAWEVCAGAGDGAHGTCYGDSGGPLVVQEPTGWTQVGIVQSGDGCASAGYYDIFTRVDRVKSFALAPHPTIQPESISPTRIRGRFAPRHTLTCVPGRFIGSPSRIRVFWVWVDANDLPRKFIGTGRRHRVTRTDRRRRLTCAANASNAGGSFTEFATPRER